MRTPPSDSWRWGILTNRKSMKQNCDQHPVQHALRLFSKKKNQTDTLYIFFNKLKPMNNICCSL
jgi:hypothetical protein